ncbi:hypothetical protein JMJ77_0014542 [Colletotrichum scovillei]|uniref:Uncharacterized protein n=1 Tax=Colletotrichum scovillei TaxID=1209932 RepID=A0A9P7R3R0_9PEZI|nr:hypothetical protein JMJ77_0014542 [Colletotrichum scovillei]KAG7066079.1 hypothetical protein JMJ78_0012816 [Colletotrichum scovillei]KAG7068679.1 hypothetical protein JMJ76_0008359 [Colletotrichum scovillei]
MFSLYWIMPILHIPKHPIDDMQLSAARHCPFVLRGEVPAESSPGNPQCVPKKPGWNKLRNSGKALIYPSKSIPVTSQQAPV